MKSMYGEELDYRPIYRNGKFYVVPYGEKDYCIVEENGAFAAGRIVYDESAFAVADIIGSIYGRAVQDCCQMIEEEFGKAGRDLTDKMRGKLAHFGLPIELSKEETERVQKEMDS